MSLPQKLTRPSGKEAELYRVLPSGRVRCTACARLCQIGEGQVGLCGIRGVVGGRLYLLAYGRIIAGHVDPIEKKPVIHYKPGSKIFSVATTGCNWLCRYCFTPETPIITDGRILSIENLFDQSAKGGEIAHPENLRVLTHKGSFMRVSKVFRHRYEGEILKIRPYYLPELHCTPNHKVYVHDRALGSLTKKRADEITTADMLAIPKIAEKNVSMSLDIEEVLSGARPHVLRATRRTSDWRLEERGGMLRYGMARSGWVPRFVALDEDLAELLGLYCAEGSVTRARDRPNSWVLTFSFGAHEPYLVERVRRLFKSIFGAETMVVRQGPVSRVSAANSVLAQLFLSLAGGNCLEKRVPSILLHHSDARLLSAFLNNYLKGDGYLTASHGRSWLGSTSVSRELSMGVWWIMARLGMAPRFYMANNPSSYRIEGRTVHRGNDYLTRVLLLTQGELSENQTSATATKMVLDRDYTLVPIRSITSAHYSGFVYNMEVEGDHSYSAGFVAVSNCQNSDISQRRRVEGIEASPSDVVSKAIEYGCDGLAYTYNQPTIFIEYARDVGVQARKRGLFNIFVSNGYDTPEAVGLMDSFLDCITVDFKGSGEREFVRKYIGIPDPEPIFRTLLDIKRRTRVHTEITDLIVPKVGDSLGAAERLCRWVFDNLGPDTPVHFLRFHPDYKMMDLPPTPVSTLEKHHSVGKKVGLNYVYIGNVPGHPAESTYCPGCGKVLIKRHGYDILQYNLDPHNRCSACGQKTPIVGPLSRSSGDERFLPVFS